MFIGPGLDTAELEKELDACLLTDDEMLLKYPRRSERQKSVTAASDDGHGHGHGKAQTAASDDEHGHGHGKAQTVASDDGHGHGHGKAPAQENSGHGHGHGHAQAQANSGHGGHHGHAHDSDGNCVEVSPEDEPWKWWRALCKDKFPPFEVDCCATGEECEEHDVRGPRTLRSAVAEDLRTRGKLATAAQEKLADATTEGDLDLMAQLLTEGVAKVNGTTVVFSGSSAEDGDQDADPAAGVESNQWTPLHIAVATHQLEAATLLLDRGADPSFVAYTKNGLTALMVAVMGSPDDAEVVELLINRGANINAIGPDGGTALHFACDMGYQECGVALILGGCITSIKDDDGMTAQKVNRMQPFLLLSCVG